MVRKIKRNRISCKKCGDIIESQSTYDFKKCGCGMVGVDGVLEYASGFFPAIQQRIIMKN